ncbi:MAG: hypothetical protein KGJ91_09805, partial [Xanthomonadaceae bacterium]|nr:hypothetical protein [Xanthomonadaceae bacterium]
AGHARAIVEGYLLFIYLTDSPASDAEMRARINVLHLADCVKRIEFLSETAAAQDHIDYYIDQRKVIQARLEKNEFFTGLSPTVRRSCLSGKKMMIRSRDQLLEATGYEKEQFDALYDLLSQHTHILTMSFYRMEPNGRGTGIENDVDRSYIGVTLKLCAEILELATARLIGLFPDALFVCNGLKSKFCPGPAENMQIKVSVDRTGGKSSRELPSHTTLVLAIHKSLVNAVELTSKHLCWYYNPATWYSAMPLLKIR